MIGQEYALVIDNGKTNYIFSSEGNKYEYKFNGKFASGTVIEPVTIDWSRSGSPGKMTFSLVTPTFVHRSESARVPTLAYDFHNGDKAQFYHNGNKIFSGYVFSKKEDKYGKVDVTCYDQIRYLKASDFFVFENQEFTVGEAIRYIVKERFALRSALDFDATGLKKDGSSYKIPYTIKRNISALDVIDYLLMLERINTAKIYAFFDDCGTLCLKDVEGEDMRFGSHIFGGKLNSKEGTETAIINYTYTEDIDKETYNQVKVVYADAKNDEDSFVVARDPGTISRWGTLQYYFELDTENTFFTIEGAARTMAAYYDRELKKLSFESIGVDRVRGGSMIFVNLPDVGIEGNWLLVDKVTHTYKNSEHTMKVDCRELDMLRLTNGMNLTVEKSFMPEFYNS